MVRLTAHYDGKVIIPDEPVELPTGVPLHVSIESNNNITDIDPILTFVGLGKEAWEGIDPVEYQRREREGWE